MASNDRHQIIIVVILASVFGFLSGMVGFIFARAYLFEKVFNIPFLGNEISVTDAYSGVSSVVFRDPKKVIVEQNTKVMETVNSGKNSIVGIFIKNEAVSPQNKTGENQEAVFDIDDFFIRNKESGQGFILTSDGWIITDFIPDKLKSLSGSDETATTSEISKILQGYRIITNNKEIYIPDDIIIDGITGYSFWHINAKDLPVKKLVGQDEIEIGQLVLAVNWRGWSWLTTVEGLGDVSEELILSSDEYSGKIMLTQKPDKEFYSSFLFNLDGALAALISDQGEITPVNNFLACVDCLLKDKKIKRAFLGVNYIDLNILVGSGENFKKGALIYKDKDGIAVVKGSPADKAGLKAGDIILSVDNVEISNSNSLNVVINKYSAGKEINIIFFRNKSEKSISLVLGEK